MRSFFALCLALLFFGGAAFIFISTGYRDQPTTATSSTAGVESNSQKRSLNREERRAERRERRRSLRNRVAPETGVVAEVGKTINRSLRQFDLSVVDMMSLFFGVLGTFFTWRSYRIQKQAAAERRMASR